MAANLLVQLLVRPFLLLLALLAMYFPGSSGQRSPPQQPQELCRTLESKTIAVTPESARGG